MTTMASQITSLTIVYSTVYSGTDQRKHQSSSSLAFVRRIHRWPVNDTNLFWTRLVQYVFDWPLWGEFTGDRWMIQIYFGPDWYYMYLNQKTIYQCHILNNAPIMPSKLLLESPSGNYMIQKHNLIGSFLPCRARDPFVIVHIVEILEQSINAQLEAYLDEYHYVLPDKSHIQKPLQLKLLHRVIDD